MLKIWVWSIEILFNPGEVFFGKCIFPSYFSPYHTSPSGEGRESAEDWCAAEQGDPFGEQ